MGIKNNKKTAQQLFDKTPYEVFFNSDEKFIIEKLKNDLNDEEKTKVNSDDNQVKNFSTQMKKHYYQIRKEENLELVKMAFPNALQRYIFDIIWKKFFIKRMRIFCYFITFIVIFLISSSVLTTKSSLDVDIFWIIIVSIVIISMIIFAFLMEKKYNMKIIIFLVFNYYNFIISLK